MNGANEPLPLSYQQFGYEFVHRLVTPERVRRELRALLAEPIEGAIARLPAELLTARYVFQLVDVVVEKRAECLPELGLRQRISGTLALSVKVLGVALRFTLQLGIRLEQQVRTYAPLTLRIETRPIEPAAVDIAVDAHNLPAEILDRLKLIDPAVRAEVVDQVNRRLNSGAIARATTIDVHRIADGAPLTGSSRKVPETKPAAPAPAASVPPRT